MGGMPVALSRIGILPCDAVGKPQEHKIVVLRGNAFPLLPVTHAQSPSRPFIQRPAL